MANALIDIPLPQNEAIVSQKVREQALARAKEIGLPGRKCETWKYAAPDIYQLAKKTLTLAPETSLPTIELPQVDAYRFIIVNGKLVEETTLPQGITLNKLNASTTQQVLENNSAFHSIPLVAMNLAYVTNGTSIHITEGTKLDKPVHIIYCTTAENDVTTHIKNTVEIEQGAAATIIETHLSNSTATYWNNHVNHITVHPSAQLTLIKTQQEQAQGYHTSCTRIALSDAAEFTQYGLAQGGKLIRNEQRVNITGKHAKAVLNGVALAADDTHIDNYIPVTHANTDSYSEQNINAVLKDKARSTFFGKVKVEKDAQQTESHQMNKNLLLSEQAQANSRPELEIYADDVQCSHGSATGEIDEDALYYLKARGLTEKQANDLLIEAFVKELFESVEQDDVKAAIEQQLQGWLATT